MCVTVKGKQKRLHRHLMECHLGRILDSSELVHHKNEDIWDNRIDNFEIVSRGEHKKKHSEIGVKTRFKKRYNLDREELLEFSKNHTYNEMAEMFSCSRGAIQRILKYKVKEEIKCILCGEKVMYVKDKLCKKHYLNRYYREKIKK